MTNLKIYFFIFSSLCFFAHTSIACDIDNYDIVVVGGGLSGLNAARTIYKTCPNTKIAIIEGRNRLGGRTHTLTMPDSNIVEAGGEIIERDEKFIQSVLEELGLEKTPIKLDGEIFCIYKDEKITLEKVVPHIETLLDKLKKIRESIPNSDHIRYDSDTTQWVYSHLNPHLNLNDFEKFLLQAIVRDECGIDLDKVPLQGVETLIEMLDGYKAIAKMKTAPVISIFGNFTLKFYDAKYRITGGTQALVQALLKGVPKESIFLGTCLTLLSRQNNHYKLQTKDGRTFRAKRVIISTPFSVLRSQYGILDDHSLGITAKLRQTIDTMTYATNSKLIVPAKEFKPTGYILNASQGGITAWENPAGMTWMLGGTPGAQLIDEHPIIKELSRNMSLMMNAKMTNQSNPIIINWSQDPLSRGSYSATSINTLRLDMYKAGSVIPELYEFAAPLNNNTLFFIGEHTCCADKPIPANGGEGIPAGHMQSALFSGHVIGKFISDLQKGKPL